MTPPQSFSRHTPGPVRIVGADIWTEHGPHTHVIAEVLGHSLVNVTYEEQAATARFLASAWDMEALLKLLDNGGTIVSSNDCSSEEIIAAQADHRFFMDADGYSYVYRPRSPTEDSTLTKSAEKYTSAEKAVSAAEIQSLLNVSLMHLNWDYRCLICGNNGSPTELKTAIHHASHCLFRRLLTPNGGGPQFPFPGEAERIKHDELARTLTEAGKDVPPYGSPEWLEAYNSMGGA